jgi:type IV pilus assembly protein PilN
MIRINLLPEAKRGAASSGGGAQIWGVIYVLATFAWAVVLLLVYLNYQGRLEEQTLKNNELQSQIDRAKGQSENIGEIESALAKSRQLEEVVAALQSARQGPARMLMELSRILSEGGGPTVNPDVLDTMRRENPLAVYNPGWDIRRLWLTSFKESERKCEIDGVGKTNEDVAEFLRRLTISELFDKVTLKETGSAKDAGCLPVVTFSLTCEVTY